MSDLDRTRGKQNDKFKCEQYSHLILTLLRELRVDESSGVARVPLIDFVTSQDLRSTDTWLTSCLILLQHGLDTAQLKLTLAQTGRYN